MRRGVGNGAGRPSEDGDGGPTKFRPRKKSLEDLLDPDCLDDQTRRMLFQQIMNPSPAAGTGAYAKEKSITSESSLSFLERLHEAAGARMDEAPRRHTQAQPLGSTSLNGDEEGEHAPYPSMLRKKVQNGSEDVITSMSRRLRDLEQKLHAYQCELKEMHDKFRQTNDMLQKSRRQNEEHENTIVTLYEAKQDLEKELQDMKTFLAMEGIRWDKHAGGSPALRPTTPEGQGSGRQRMAGVALTATEERQPEGAEPRKEPEEEGRGKGFNLYEGECTETMDPAAAEAVLAASGPRHFPNSAKERGAQLYSRRRNVPQKQSESQPGPTSSSGAAPERGPVVDMELLQRNARILSDYVGYSEVVVSGQQGHIRDRDVVRVAIYKNGICVNNGPFRPFGWPLCEAFLLDLAEGFYPYEFKEKYPDGFPLLVTDKRDEECDPSKATGGGQWGEGGRAAGFKNDGGYHPVSREEFLKRLPEKKITPSGRVVDVRGAVAGMMGGDPPASREPIQHISRAQHRVAQGSLAVPQHATEKIGKEEGSPRSSIGSPRNQASARSNQSPSSSPAPNSPLSGDPEFPHLVPVLIRVPSGQQVAMKLSPTDTIAVLREEFIAAAPEFGHRTFELCQAYPPKTFVDYKKTLQECGLTKSSALMKIIDIFLALCLCVYDGCISDISEYLWFIVYFIIMLFLVFICLFVWRAAEAQYHYPSYCAETCRAVVWRRATGAPQQHGLCVSRGGVGGCCDGFALSGSNVKVKSDEKFSTSAVCMSCAVKHERSSPLVKEAPARRAAYSNHVVSPTDSEIQTDILFNFALLLLLFSFIFVSIFTQQGQEDTSREVPLRKQPPIQNSTSFNYVVATAGSDIHLHTLGCDMQRVVSFLRSTSPHPCKDVEKWVQAIVWEGRAQAVLAELNKLKSAAALCFLCGEGNLFEVRQALLEELRAYPHHAAARDLVQRIGPLVRPALLPPPSLTSSSGTLSGEHALSPLFSTLCNGLLDHTMLSWKRLFNLYSATEQLYFSEWHSLQGEAHPVRAPIVECGTAGGGAAVMMAVVADHLERRLASAFPHKALAPKRLVFCLDTFAGMPAPGTEDVLWRTSTLRGANASEEASQEEGIEVVPARDTAWGAGTCAGTAQGVRDLAESFGVADRLVILPGLFHQTIPRDLLAHPALQTTTGATAPPGNTSLQLEQGGAIGLLHVDADWYASTKFVLEHLLPHLLHSKTDPAVVQVDDYFYWRGCQKAVDEVLAPYREKGMQLTLDPIDINAVFFEWR
eukprot:gene6749-4841_t